MEPVKVALSLSLSVELVLELGLPELQISLFGDRNSCLLIPLFGVLLFEYVFLPESQCHFRLFTCTDKIVQSSVILQLGVCDALVHPNDRTSSMALGETNNQSLSSLQDNSADIIIQSSALFGDLVYNVDADRLDSQLPRYPAELNGDSHVDCAELSTYEL